jgi:alkylation response protein AidB-like acyl-CoA dehydrogenase
MEPMGDDEVMDLDGPIASLRALIGDGASIEEVLGLRFDLGLAWPQYPEGLGGLGLGNDGAGAVLKALAEAGVPNPPVSFVGPHLVSPMLVSHGTPRQRSLLRPTFTGQARWCQLFSEPSAGSDLANVSTSAICDGEVWSIRGQKVWNSFAAEATHGILLARTDPGLPKHRGMSMFLVDMSDPGVTVRPLRDMTGVAHFNEVFLDDVTVHDDFRLGAAHEGWRLAIEVLAHERLAVGRAAADEAGGRPRPLQQFLPDPQRLRGALRDRYVRVWIDEQVVNYTEARMVDELLSGRPCVDPIALRVLATEHNYDVLDLAMDVGGPGALLYDHAAAHDDASNMQRDYLYARGLMIGGGTLEVCRNQIGERVLGLPAEPRVDKDRPWRETSGRAAGEQARPRS